MQKREKIKLLIADDQGQLMVKIARFLERSGFEVRHTSDGFRARDIVDKWRPRFVIADLLLPNVNAIELLSFIRNDPSQKDTQLLVVSNHNDTKNVREAFKWGAIDYMVKPFSPAELLNRLVFHLQKVRQVPPIKETDYNKVEDTSLMLHLIDLVLRQALHEPNIEKKLHNLTRMVSMKLSGVRCSIIQYVDPQTGVVVTSNDDMSASGIVLNLSKYPEVHRVMNSGKVFAIENIDANPEYNHIKENLKNINFNSIIVSPVERNREIFGVLSLRLPPDKLRITDNEIRFVQIASHVISLTLNSRALSQSNDFWRKTG